MARGKGKSSAAAAASEESLAECCAKCESDIAVLRKEIAALKRELAKKPAGGVDPRLDKLIEVIKASSPAMKGKLSEAPLWIFLQA